MFYRWAATSPQIKYRQIQRPFPRVNISSEQSVTLLISSGQKLIPTIKVCPTRVAYGNLSVTVPPEVGSRLKVAFWITEMAVAEVWHRPQWTGHSRRRNLLRSPRNSMAYHW